MDPFDVAGNPPGGSVPAGGGEPLFVDRSRAVRQPGEAILALDFLTLRGWKLGNNLLHEFRKAGD